MVVAVVVVVVMVVVMMVVGCRHFPNPKTSFFRYGRFQYVSTILKATRQKGRGRL
jgi:hypothetical protein